MDNGILSTWDVELKILENLFIIAKVLGGSFPYVFLNLWHVLQCLTNLLAYYNTFPIECSYQYFIRPIISWVTYIMMGKTVSISNSSNNIVQYSMIIDSYNTHHMCNTTTLFVVNTGMKSSWITLVNSSKVTISLQYNLHSS